MAYRTLIFAGHHPYTYASFKAFTGHYLESKSLYDVLGVAPDSDQADIKKAFISQSKKMHPDMVSRRTDIFA